MFPVGKTQKSGFRGGRTAPHPIPDIDASVPVGLNDCSLIDYRERIVWRRGAFRKSSDVASLPFSITQQGKMDKA
jgi:hypothetical protein